MAPATVNDVTFQVKGPDGSPVPGTVTYAGTTGTFTPTSNLAANTTFTATITTGAQNLAGNALAADYTWSFTTGATPDTTAPTVISTDPAGAATGVAINAKTSASFSEAMDPTTFSTDTFTLKQGATSVPGTVTYAGTTAVFTPTSNLAANTTFTATITTGAKDLAGHALAANYAWSFTTSATADTTAPTVSSTVPANAATGVPVGNKITAAFSEAMDPATINTSTFLLVQDGTFVPGTVTYAGTTATFTPTSSLAGNSAFTATITTGAKDLAGNALAANYAWGFTAGATPDTTAPTVSSTDPVGAAIGVATNARISAAFSEAMDAATIRTATFTLKQGATSVPGTVTYAGTTAVYTPASSLAGNTTFTAAITTGTHDLAGNALAADYTWSFTTGATADTTAPTVSSTSPLNAATGVSVGNRLTAAFSEAMDPATIGTSTFALVQGATSVPGTVTYAGKTATFTPSSNLAANTAFTATITTGAKDLAGNALAANYAWSFTTSATADTTAPTVSSTSPLNAATGVSIDRKVSATFSEVMNAATISTATFTLKQGATSVPGTVTYAGTTATFKPASNLAGNTTFTATVTNAVQDLAGNVLAANHTWSFTTGSTPDTTAPTVTSTDPANSATGVGTNTRLTASFGEAMDPATLSTATFTLKQGATSVPGTVTDTGTAAVFTPTSDLAGNTTFTATITTGAEDLAGNALAANHTWSFTTGATPDTTAPTVTSTAPANAATGVAVGSNISVTFSEVMNAATISTAAFTLKRGATSVPGAVTYAGTTATFKPTSELAGNATFTATITTGAKDLAGNALAANHTWGFTTGATPDITAPTVSSTDPANAATGVAIGRKVSVTFSEAMTAATISTATFTLKQGATSIPGTVTYSGTTATFTPTSSLTGNTTFTATITTGAKDLAGNALAADYAWSFTTGAVADTTAPTVSFTDPANNATGVPVGNRVTATFSEAMDPATFSTTTFTFKQGTTSVPGTVTYSGTTATFTPTSNLAGNTMFTTTITSGVEDLAGNALVANHTWEFTTGATPDTTAPTVSSTAPANAATDVPVGSKISAAFSEAMTAATISTATFTLKRGATSVPGAVAYAGTTATFTPASNLAGNATFTATITTGAEDLAGNALAADYTWSFTTGATPDTTAPTVLSTAPANAATGVSVSSKVTASFSEAMDPATINATTFALRQGATLVPGTVTYAGTTATFTPTSNLAGNTTFTATITTGAKDLAGNGVAANHAWDFQTGATPDTTRPTVGSTIPANAATDVPVGNKVSATFSEAMDPATISTATFTLKQGVTPVPGTVAYAGATATFTPASNLAGNTTFTATITTGAKDLAGNALAADYTWSFTTGVLPHLGPDPVFLGDANAFAVLAGSTVTNTALITTVNGDLGVSPGSAVSGFPPGIVNGSIYTGVGSAAGPAKAALTTAYNDAAGRTVNVITVAGNLGGQTLAPGLYKSTSSLEISSGDLTLDAQGDVNAVWIFQMASTLTTTPGRQVILAGGANPDKIYWQVGSSATLGTTSIFKGNILAAVSVTIGTGATLEGRALTSSGAVTLDGNTVTAPTGRSRTPSAGRGRGRSRR